LRHSFQGSTVPKPSRTPENLRIFTNSVQPRLPDLRPMK
jgi:hypothetical protein